MSGIKSKLRDLGKSFDKFKNQIRHEEESKQREQAEEADDSKGFQLADQREERAGEEGDTPGNQEILKP